MTRTRTKTTNANGTGHRPNDCRFPLGQVVSTPGALAALDHEDILKALARHVRGDWGVVDVEDWDENERGLKYHLRLVSVYEMVSGDRFWVITEADRSVTTVLMPAGRGSALEY